MKYIKCSCGEIIDDISKVGLSAKANILYDLDIDDDGSINRDRRDEEEEEFLEENKLFCKECGGYLDIKDVDEYLEKLAKKSTKKEV